MEGKVVDITEWAMCHNSLSHLQPNSHIVQYRIVLGQQVSSIFISIPTICEYFEIMIANVYLSVRLCIGG